jgi:hypothetical protein
MLLAKASLQNVWMVEHLFLRMREATFLSCRAIVLNVHLAALVADHGDVRA